MLEVENAFVYNTGLKKEFSRLHDIHTIKYALMLSEHDQRRERRESFWVAKVELSIGCLMFISQTTSRPPVETAHIGTHRALSLNPILILQWSRLRAHFC